MWHLERPKTLLIDNRPWEWGRLDTIMKEQEFARRQRRARVVHDWLAGGSVTQIARTHGLTPGGVRYIIDTTPGARGQREVLDARAERARVEELHRALVAWSQEHPGVPLSVAGEQHGLTVQEVADLLGERARFHPARRAASQPRYSDEEMLERVRDHVTATGDRRASTYRQAARDHDWPSLDTILWRFGTWRQVLGAAGLPASPCRFKGRPQTISDAELRGWIARYLADTTRPTWRDLEAWMKTNRGPSASLIRHRIGGWAEVLACHQNTHPTPPA